MSHFSDDFSTQTRSHASHDYFWPADMIINTLQKMSAWSVKYAKTRSCPQTTCIFVEANDVFPCGLKTVKLWIGTTWIRAPGEPSYSMGLMNHKIWRICNVRCISVKETPHNSLEPFGKCTWWRKAWAGWALYENIYNVSPGDISTVSALWYLTQQ